MKADERMSVVDLVVLGILMDEPMNAYRLARFIDERQLGRLVKISKPVVYKSCKRLKNGGYLDSETLRESEMPEKVVYTVNQPGRERFNQLMWHFSNNLNHFHFEFNSFIWNLPHLKHEEGARLLENLHSELEQVLGWLVIHQKEAAAQATFGTRMVVKQYRMVISTLVEWVEEVIAEYKNMGGEKR